MTRKRDAAHFGSRIIPEQAPSRFLIVFWSFSSPNAPATRVIPWRAERAREVRNEVFYETRYLLAGDRAVLAGDVWGRSLPPSRRRLQVSPPRVRANRLLESGPRRGLRHVAAPGDPLSCSTWLNPL